MKNLNKNKTFRIFFIIFMSIIISIDIVVGIEYCIVYHLNFIEIVSAFSAVLFLVGLGWVGYKTKTLKESDAFDPNFNKKGV